MTAQILKEAISHNIAATVATICLMIYFLGTAIVFISKPLKYGKNYSIQPVDNAGKTEIRVYYGAISAALGLVSRFSRVCVRKAVLCALRRTFLLQRGVLDEIDIHFCGQGLEMPLYKTCHTCRRRVYSCAVDMLYNCKSG